MINTQLHTSTQTNNKNEIKPQNKSDESKIQGRENNSSLSEILKKNLPSLAHQNNQGFDQASEEKLNQQLQKLINKLLEQISSQKIPNESPMQQSAKLKLAPNFGNELKLLSAELAKDDIFTQVLQKLEEILKPASKLSSKDLAPLLKNSGLFLEAKLKDALNPQSLPKSFHALISTIKTLNSEKLSQDILNLAAKDMDAKSSLEELKTLLLTHKNENKALILNSPFKSLAKLSIELENFKFYINKNPQILENKVQKLASRILQSLNKIEQNFKQELSKPQNIALKDTGFLKIIAQNFEALKNKVQILNKNPQNIAEQTQNQEKPILTKQETQVLQETKTTQENKAQINDNKSILQEKNENTKQEQKQNNPQDKQDKGQTTIQEKNESLSQNKNLNPTQDKNPNQDKNQSPIQDKNSNNTQNTNEKTINTQENKSNSNENKTISQDKNQNISQEKNTQNTQENQNKFFQSLKENKNPSQSPKNLIFDTQNKTMATLENLSKELNSLSKKLNEGLKQLDERASKASLNLKDIKNLDHKISAAMKDLHHISTKHTNFLSEELKNDIKSTLLQTLNLAKSSDNEAVINQTNRLLAQIEINQLLSLANNNISTNLPLFWEDLNESKIMFKQGKKDRYFAQIKLHFAKLGELDIFLALNANKYIDINIMAENKEFRKSIYENAHELRRNLSKVGLLSSNFFVGDIIRSKLDTPKARDYSFEMGVDKKA